MALGVGVLAAVPAAHAKTFPERPLRWIVPLAPGGGTDLTTRIVAQKLADFVGQPVVVDNRVGASGNIGGWIAAHAPADGYTLVTLTASHPANHAVVGNAPFDLVRDLAPVTQLTAQAYVLLVHPSVAAKSVKELIDVARARSGALHYGSSGVGTLQHLAGVMFGAMTGTELVHVPYKGGALVLPDLIAGRLQFFFGVMLSSVPHIRSGKVRALAVTGVKRTAALADLPTIAEAGLPGYAVQNWYGVAVPAKTPPATVARLNAEITRALKTEDVRERLAKDGSDAVGGSAKDFGNTLRDDLQRWRRLAQEGRIQAE